MSSSGERYVAPVLAALLFHAGALGLLQTADEEDPDDWEDETIVELEPPELAELPRPKPPAPKPKPPPEPVEEKPAVVLKPQPKVVAKAEPKRTPPPVVPDAPDEDTASGDPDLPAPGGTFKMEDIVPGGAAMGGVGSSNSSGTGGSGSGTEKGGDGGSGKGTKKPVSIASIKKKAMPINNRDVISDRKFNDISGNVVVKLIVDSSGKVVKATLIKRLKPEVDRIALGWAKQLRFKPAIDQNDKPVTSVVNWTFTFRTPT